MDIILGDDEYDDASKLQDYMTNMDSMLKTNNSIGSTSTAGPEMSFEQFVKAPQPSSFMPPLGLGYQWSVPQ